MVDLWSESPRASDYAPESAEANVLARNGYMLGAEIGSGSYATIAIVAKENLAYACKIVNMGETSREYRTRFLPREINILARLRHPNIARVFQIICEARKVFFIMELATAGDLLFKIQCLDHRNQQNYIQSINKIMRASRECFGLDWTKDECVLQNAGRLHERTAHHIFVQLASAVAYLHRHNIAHRDLKCENVLLTTQLVVKLADFSFSRYCNDPVVRRKKLYSETYCGSEAYAPPEVLQGIPYQPKKADMWSLGVILYVMMTAALPFENDNIVRQVRLQMNRVIRFPRHMESTHEYRNLVRLLLEPVTTIRATMGMVVKHPWLLLYPDPTNTSLDTILPFTLHAQDSVAETLCRAEEATEDQALTESGPPDETLIREVEPRAVSPVLRGPVLVSEQPRPAVIDERGNPLPALTRQPAAEDVHTGAFGAEPLFPDESESDEYFDENLHTEGQQDWGEADSPLFLETGTVELHETPQDDVDNLPLSKGGASKKFLENKDDVLTATVILDSATDSRITSDAGIETGDLALQARDSLGDERHPDHSTDLDESFGIRLPLLDGHDNSVFAVGGPEYESAGWGRSKSADERTSPESINYLQREYY
ncbi:testis-specific serine/threonine-protein kinase 1-like [Rhipicephalus sanguineus]|uniref:testis-specific serine/threonine-protein kinase 1-like n=1 Tax=Rhipicephalus sanguineus TaxID=34632 RepID=UPI001893286D|nr:testis-specific serine/threonine-protein kinase 1-like [Rhipicephalus sanguineus]